MRIITTALLVLLATVPVSADETSESSISEPSARSPVHEPQVRQRAAVQNTRSPGRHGPLHPVQIGPKPKNAHAFGREGTTPHHYIVGVDLVPRSAT